MSKVATEVSSSLFWHPFEGVIEKEPLFVQYQRYQAQSATPSEISWYIESPANGVLLDNEVWLHTTMTIIDAAFNAGGALRNAWCVGANATYLTKGVAYDMDILTAFRSGCIMQRACQSIALDINGTVMTYEFSKYHDAFNRMFLTKEEAGSVFPSGGGCLDDGSHLGNYEGYYPNAVSRALLGAQVTNVTNEAIGKNKYRSGTAQNAAVLCDFYGNNYRLTNMGFTKRAEWFEYLWRTSNNAGNNGGRRAYDDGQSQADTGAVGLRYPSPITLHLYEKLAFSPFHLYDNRDIKMSIPNIRNFSLTMQFYSSYWNNMFRCARSTPTMSSTSVDFYSVKPELLLRWYTPPSGYVIPKQVTMPVTKVWTYTNSTLPVKDISAVYGGGYNYPISMSDGFSVSNISLPAVPDLFLIYFKRRLSDYDVNYPDDYNLSIKSIQIDFEGNSGKLNNTSPVHFWNMYRRHLRLYPADRDDFESWYRYHCVLAITASDMGVIKGPGMDNPIQLSLSNMVLDYYYMLPSYAQLSNSASAAIPVAGLIDPDFNPETGNDKVAFDLHIVCVYDKYALTLTSDGSSALQLLRVNSAGTSTAPPMAVGPSSLADISI